MRISNNAVVLGTLLALMLGVGQVQAATSISTDTVCSTCLTGGSVVCRTSYYDRYAYCCDQTEVGTRSCGGSTAFCTTNALNPVMQFYACPYSYNYCGASSSEIEMHPENRNNIRLEIANRFYVSGETCYYEFSVPETYLDLEYFAYFWDVEFTTRTNVVAQLNNGTSVFTANDPITVSSTTGNRFQYTAHGNNKIYMSFTANAANPGFGLSIRVRTFRIKADPNTPEP